ncbi:hypothetical protein JOC34_001717 [Virgibacillus halotolerans]|nr:hypothetical protein [Virgibacillus halotolerans]
MDKRFNSLGDRFTGLEKRLEENVDTLSTNASVAVISLSN